MTLQADVVVLGHAAASVMLGWLAFRRLPLKRPTIGVFGLADVGFLLGGILVVPLLYLMLPLWVVGGLLALGALSALSLLAEPLLPCHAVRWAVLFALAAAEIGSWWAGGGPGTETFEVNNVVTVLLAVAVVNLWAQSGMKARDAAILGAALAVYDFVATWQLSLMGDLFARVAGLPFAPLVAWPVGADGRWLGLGLGDLLLLTAFPLVQRKAYGRRAGLVAVVTGLGTLVGIVALAPVAGIVTFPVMIVLGPLMVVEYAWCARRLGSERTTHQYRLAEPARQPELRPWRHRLGCVALAALVLAGSAGLPPSRAARAEARLDIQIPIDGAPNFVRINLVNGRVYVTDALNSVHVIDSATNTAVGSPIPIGSNPADVGINPTTNRLYVANLNDATVTVIDATTNTVIGSPIPVGHSPINVGVNPVTNRVYVANNADGTVSVIDGRTNAVIGVPIPVGLGANGAGVDPITNRIYTTTFDQTLKTSVLVAIDGATNTVTGSPVPVGSGVFNLTVDPATNRVYVAVSGEDSVKVIDGATNTLMGSPIKVGSQPFDLAINPAANLLYVTNFNNASVTVIDMTTNTVVGTAGQVQHPGGIAVSAVTNQAYVAEPKPGQSSLVVLGVPFSTGPSLTRPDSAVSATWSDLFAPNGGDFVGLFETSAPNSSPLTRALTNGTAAPTGPGSRDGSVDLPLPSTLAVGGSYEARLVSGASGGTLARLALTPPAAANDAYTVKPEDTLTVAAPGVLANDTTGDPSRIQATVVSNPTHGTPSLQVDGAFTYTPGATFSGLDSFIYRATSKDRPVGDGDRVDRRLGRAGRGQRRLQRRRRGLSERPRTRRSRQRRRR